ncbi:hypothetical protein GCM10028824_43770 [Hymenobacter segetis]
MWSLLWQKLIFGVIKSKKQYKMLMIFMPFLTINQLVKAEFQRGFFTLPYAGTRPYLPVASGAT